MLFLGFLMPVCALAALAGFIWLLVVAFKRSAGWGLAVLFLSPIAAIVFAVKHWQDSKKPFLVYAGSGAAAVAVMMVTVATLGMRVANEFDAAMMEAQQSGEWTMTTEPTGAMPSAMMEMTGNVEVPEVESEPMDDTIETIAAEPAAAERRAGGALRMASVLPGQGGADAAGALLDLAGGDTSAYQEISLAEAPRHVGAAMRIHAHDGRIMRATLAAVEHDRLRFEKHLSAGTFSFDVLRSEVRSLELQQ